MQKEKLLRPLSKTPRLPKELLKCILEIHFPSAGICHCKKPVHLPSVSEHFAISVSFYMQEKLSAYVNCKRNGLGMYIFRFYSSHTINAHNWLRLGLVYRHLFVNRATAIFYLNCGILFTDFTGLKSGEGTFEKMAHRVFHFQLL